MFNVLVTGCELTAGMHFARCLALGRGADADVRTIGVARHPGRAVLAETDETFLLPPDVPDTPQAILDDVQDRLGATIDLFYESRSGRPTLGASAARASVPVFLPDARALDTFEDKFLTASWLAAGAGPAPLTRLLTAPADVTAAFAELGGREAWVRSTTGYAGAGAFAATSAEQVIAQIEARSGWGAFALSERLPDGEALSWEDRLGDRVCPGETVSWMGLFHEGKRLAGQARKRLYFEHRDLTSGGVSHVGGLMNLADPAVDRLAEAVIRAFPAPPHGAIGVDFMADARGELKVTEIQAGRFFATTYFHALHGLNFPQRYVAAWRGRPACDETPTRTGDGLVWLQRFGAGDTLCHRDDIRDLLAGRAARPAAARGAVRITPRAAAILQPEPVA